jgi:hypothetical protein
MGGFHDAARRLFSLLDFQAENKRTKSRTVELFQGTETLFGFSGAGGAG